MPQRRADTVFDVASSPDEWERLVHGCCARDADAFTRLVELSEPRLRRLLRRLVGVSHAAVAAGVVDDLLQETFLRAWRRIDRFRGESGLMTWLTRIAINVGLNFRRDRKPAVSLDQYEENSGQITPGQQPGLSETVLRESFQRAVAQLPEDLRTVFVLQQSEDLSYQQIAELLECPIGTVMSRLHRARAVVLPLLRERLEELVP